MRKGGEDVVQERRPEGKNGTSNQEDFPSLRKKRGKWKRVERKQKKDLLGKNRGTIQLKKGMPNKGKRGENGKGRAYLKAIMNLQGRWGRRWKGKKVR